MTTNHPPLAGHIISLRPYQLAAITKLRHSLAGGYRRVMLYSPTGSGKTVTAEAMIRGALAKGKRVAFIANRKQLVGQASAHLSAAGIPHGILQADNTRDLDARVLVCSIDTIAARGFPDDIGLIVIDEAHACAGSAKYRRLLDRYNRVPTIGLSATPFAPGLGQVFGDMVIAATIRDLIGDGYLVDVDVFAPASPDLTGVKTRRGIGGEVDYAEVALGEAMDRPDLVGDIIAHWRRLAAGKQTVVFASSIPHSQHIAAQFCASGVSAEHIDYHADDDTRADILARFRRGEFRVLCNVALLAEGWDCPATEVMVLARPTKSLTRFVQMVGRVLRPAPGKARALLLDHSGTTLDLGYPTDDLPLVLDSGKANKAGSAKARERKPSPCPACKFVRPAGVHKCPSCGFEPVRQNDVEVTDGTLEKVERKPRTPATADRKQQVYSMLLSVARSKHYSPGWVAHQYRAMFGVWPRNMRDVPAAPSNEILSWLKSQRIRFAKGRGKQQEARNHG
ncbi:MAG: DEAD/DEAH box helicase [Rhodocyclaceae bacterium]